MTIVLVVLFQDVCLQSISEQYLALLTIPTFVIINAMSVATFDFMTHLRHI